MHEIKELLSSPGWWFSTVFIAVVVNVISGYVSKIIDQIKEFDQLYHIVHLSYVLSVVGVVLYAGIYTHIASAFIVSDSVLNSTMVFILGMACLNFGMYNMNFLVERQQLYRVATVIIVVLTVIMLIVFSKNASVDEIAVIVVTLNLFGILIMLFVVAVSRLFYFVSKMIPSDGRGSHNG